jgi:hypothetical protein
VRCLQLSCSHPGCLVVGLSRGVLVPIICPPGPRPERTSSSSCVTGERSSSRRA